MTFICPWCATSSEHPDDERERYCQHCKAFPYQRFAVRRFGDRRQAVDAYARLAQRLVARKAEPNGADPNVSVAVGIDADSASGFVVVYGTDELEVGLEADWIAGEPIDPAEVPLEYLQGLAARRREGELLGPLTLNIERRPQRLRADGSTES